LRIIFLLTFAVTAFYLQQHFSLAKAFIFTATSTFLALHTYVRLAIIIHCKILALFSTFNFAAASFFQFAVH